MPPSAHIVTINISSPLLQTGEHFEVKHRLSTSSTWIVDANQTTNIFAINVGSAGTWIFSITLVKADGTKCDSVEYTVPLTDPVCNCFTGVVGNIESVIAGQWRIRINYTPPTAMPGCSLEVTYTGNDGVTRSQTFTPPYPNPIIITNAVYSQAYTVLVDFDCCGRNIIRCATLDLPTPSSVCTPSVWGPAENQRRVRQIGGQWLLTVIMTAQSIPASASVIAIYQQTSGMLPGQIGDSGQVTLTGSGPSFDIPIHPVGPSLATYSVTILDVCGNKISVA